MANGLWETIDMALVPQFACVAELEDEITNLLHGERTKQEPLPFDICLASDSVLTLLSANVKVLCMRQRDYICRQRALNRARIVIACGVRTGFRWKDPCNDPEKVEAPEVSWVLPEVLESCELNGDQPMDRVHRVSEKGGRLATVTSLSTEDGQSYQACSPC